MNIGIIGAGEMGRCLASGLVKLGHKVSIANSREPASLADVALSTGATAVSLNEVIKDKQVVIISIPLKSVPDLPKNLFKNMFGDLVVIDTANYYPSLRDGILPELEETGIDSLWVQQQLNVPIVKTFNSILATSIQNLGRPKGDADRIAIAISSDDANAKRITSKLVDELGFDPVDLGNIAQSWKQQPGSPIYCRDITLKELYKRIENMSNDWSEMREVILTKRKANEVLMKADYPAYLQSLKDNL
jgi:predicted dinucleotide-binding enzyme